MAEDEARGVSTVRVALCQLEAHPAIRASHIDYIDEPFVPAKPTCSLSHLANRGVDLDPLIERVRAGYLAWQDVRAAAVLEWIGKLNPTPDLVLFPEGSVPATSLGKFAAYCRVTGGHLVAGTHSYRRDGAAQRAYQDIGIAATELTKMNKYGTVSVLPLLSPTKSRLVAKSLVSPFERSVLAKPDAAIPTRRPARLEVGNDGRIRVLPLICSEALQLHEVTEAYDLVALPSCDAKPTQFAAFGNQQVRNKRPVIYCNDGRAGGSRIFVPLDERTPDWLNASFPSGLPPGDAVLVVDLDLSAQAVEVGTAVPALPYTLVALGSVVGASSPAGETARVLSELREVAPGAARTSDLQRVVSDDRSDALQRARARHLLRLEERGEDTTAWWDAIGSDCVVTDQPSLAQLEAELAGLVAKDLLDQVGSRVSSDPTLSREVLAYLVECKNRSAGQSLETSYPPRRRAGTVDRELEAQEILDFIDDPNLCVLEITGLPEIGKSSALTKALETSGLDRAPFIRLTETSTADYLVYSLLQAGGGHPKPPYDNAAEVALSDVMRVVFQRYRVIEIQQVHHLAPWGRWRTDELPGVVDALVTLAEETGTKLVLEGRRILPFNAQDPTRRKQIRVRGLPPEFAGTLFDAQLRRVNLAPREIDPEKRKVIVKRLGGHPVAVALAAEMTYELGIDEAIRAVRQKAGHVLHYVRQLLRGLALSDDHLRLLQLLCLARGPVPRDAVVAVGPENATRVLRELIAMNAVEVAPDSFVQVADILRAHLDVDELPPDVTRDFHRAVATALSAVTATGPRALGLRVEASYHASLGGQPVTENDGLVDAAVATAQTMFDSQDYEGAALVINRLLRRKKKPIDALRLGALVEARRSRFDTALTLAKEAFARDPGDTRLLADLAGIALTQHQSDTVVEELIAIARKSGVEDVSILVVEGRMLLRQHDLGGAEKVLARAIQLTEYNPWPFFYAGIVQLRLGEVEEAIDVLFSGEEFFHSRRCRSRRALDAIRTKLAYAYVLAERWDSAESYLQQLLETSRPHPEAIRAYAALTIKRDGIDEAHKALEKLKKAKIKNASDRCQFHLLYGLFYLEIDDQARASAEFEKAHQAQRDNVFVMMKWAKLQYDLASDLFAEGDDGYQRCAGNCARLVRRILTIDNDNRVGLALLQDLRTKFQIDV